MYVKIIYAKVKHLFQFQVGEYWHFNVLFAEITFVLYGSTVRIGRYPLTCFLYSVGDMPMILLNRREK